MPTPYAETRSQKICSVEPYVVICLITGILILVIALGLTYYNIPDTPAANLDALDNDLWITMNVDQMWENFKARFNKSYGEEGERKFETFKVNLATYLDAGRKNPLALLSFTKFSDLNETAGELLNYTGLNSEVQLSAVGGTALQDARAARNGSTVSSAQDKGGGGSETPFTAVRRGTAQWNVLKEKPLSAFRIPQRHGHAFRVKNAIRRATKDPQSVISKHGNSHYKRNNARVAQPLQDSAGAHIIIVSGLCDSGNNNFAEGEYIKQGTLPNGYPYWRHERGDGQHYWIFYDEQCDEGQAQASAGPTWRLVRLPVDATRTKRIVPYDNGPASCTAVSNIQLYKDETRTGVKEPFEGTKLWWYRSKCTSWGWQQRHVTMLLDRNTWSWGYEGKVTAIRNQGACGSCWAFSGIAAIESAWMIGAGTGGSPHEDLSEQMFLDCEDDFNSCNGGYNPTAFMDPIETNAARFGHVNYGGGHVVIEANYGYRNNDGATWCRMNLNRMIGAVMVSMTRPLIGSLNEYGGADDDRAPKDDIVQAALQTAGPVFIAVYTNGHYGWFGYNGGILTDCSATPYYSAPLDMYAGDHAVVIIGFGVDSTNGVDQKYWIVKNAWGLEWGEGGYIRIARGADPPCALTPYVYVAADPVECPIASEVTGSANLQKGRVLRRFRSVLATCQAACCAELACEGFNWNVGGSATHKDCILRTELDTATEPIPSGDYVDTLYTLQPDLRADVNCEPFSISNHPMTALNGEVFKEGFADKIVGGKSTYWSDNFYMFWCRHQQSWHIAYATTYAQNLSPGQCNGIARKADPSHYSTPGGWWYYNTANQWWEATPNINMHCGGCNTFVLQNVGGAPTDNYLGTTWTADYNKMEGGKPTFWNPGSSYFMWYASGCQPLGWKVMPAANYPMGSGCSYLARTDATGVGSMPYMTRKWASAFAGVSGNWWEDAFAFEMKGVCTGTAQVNPNDYCESCEGRGLSLPTTSSREEATTRQEAMPAGRRALPQATCDQFQLNNFNVSDLNGHFWYREDSKVVDSQSTWWTTDLQAGVRYYAFYCANATEWRIVDEEKWPQHANYAPACNPYKMATATALPTGSGSVSFTEAVSGAVVSVTADCTRPQMYDVHGFADASQNDFYHEIAGKTVGGATTYWHPNGQWFVYQCKTTGNGNDGRWLLAAQADFTAISGGACTGTARHTSSGAYTPVGSVTQTTVWEAVSGGAALTGAVTTVVDGFCPNVEVRGIYDAAWGSNGWYEKDTSKMFGSKPTYWVQDETWFIYYCSSLSVWHLRPGTDWDTTVGPNGAGGGSCMPGDEANRLRGNLDGSMHFAYPRSGNWQLRTGGAWQTQNTGNNRMIVACRYPDSFKFTGFTNTLANDYFLRRDTHYKNNAPTFWTADNEVFVYHCSQNGQWAMAGGNQWHTISMAGAACDSIGLKSGTLTRPMTGEGIWTEYLGGQFQPINHGITLGTCPRTIMSGFRQNKLNQVFQIWEGK
eukprot:Hpha_TRINITY_DN16868_c3_g14::TRINITY_DN16868_c3_g14_i1::g.152768::m.152768